MYINLFNKTEKEQYKILTKDKILPLTYRLLYHYLCFIFIILNNYKLDLNHLLNINKSKREISRVAFTLPKIIKDIKLYSLIVTIIKTVNTFTKNKTKILKCKVKEFKINMKNNIVIIYEESCFKMDPIFQLEFDRKKYVDEQIKIALLKKQNETNNTND